MNGSALGQYAGTSPVSVEVGEEQLRLPRITLVTAVYNGEAYLEDTVRSIVYRGHSNLEYFIVGRCRTPRHAATARFRAEATV